MYALAISWMYLNGFGITQFLFSIFNTSSSASVVDELSLSYPYLMQFIDSLTPAFLILLFIKERRWVLFFLFILQLSIYISLGFRYRLIIFFMAFIFYMLFSSRVDFKQIAKVFWGVILAFITLYTVTMYRGEIRERAVGIEASNVIVDDSGLEKIHKSIRNYMSFSSLYGYMEDTDQEHGLGSTMILQVFVRAIPSVLFEDGIKPKPLSNVVSAKSWGSYVGLNAGEAYSHIAEAYFEFGMVGVILIAFLFGTLLSKMRNVTIDTGFKLVFISFTSGSLFHFITRGYFPGYIMAYAYGLIPILFAMFVTKYRVVFNE